jgi:ssDNA-specific exonuclease RecJ
MHHLKQSEFEIMFGFGSQKNSFLNENDARIADKEEFREVYKIILDFPSLSMDKSAIFRPK